MTAKVARSPRRRWNARAALALDGSFSRSCRTTGDDLLTSRARVSASHASIKSIASVPALPRGTIFPADHPPFRPTSHASRASASMWFRCGRGVGALPDFDAVCRNGARASGWEIALDYGLQCSPDRT